MCDQILLEKSTNIIKRCFMYINNNKISGEDFEELNFEAE